mgnify:CR=1 FL=1
MKTFSQFITEEHKTLSRKNPSSEAIKNIFTHGDFESTDTSTWPKKMRYVRPTKPGTYVSFDYYTQTGLAKDFAVYTATKGNRTLTITNL